MKIRIKVKYTDETEKEVELHAEEAYSQLRKLLSRMAFGDPDLVAFEAEKLK